MVPSDGSKGSFCSCLGNALGLLCCVCFAGCGKEGVQLFRVGFRPSLVFEFLVGGDGKGSREEEKVEGDVQTERQIKVGWRCLVHPSQFSPIQLCLLGDIVWTAYAGLGALSLLPILFPRGTHTFFLVVVVLPVFPSQHTRARVDVRTTAVWGV